MKRSQNSKRKHRTKRKKRRTNTTPWSIVKNTLKKGRHKYGRSYNIGNALVDAKKK